MEQSSTDQGWSSQPQWYFVMMWYILQAYEGPAYEGPVSATFQQANDLYAELWQCHDRALLPPCHWPPGMLSVDSCTT